MVSTSDLQANITCMNMLAKLSQSDNTSRGETLRRAVQINMSVAVLPCLNAEWTRHKEHEMIHMVLQKSLGRG